MNKNKDYPIRARSFASLLLLIAVAISSVGCATTNHYDAQVAFYEAQGQIESARAQAAVLAAQERTKQAQALASAPMGGMSVTLDDGKVLTYNNPNLYFTGSNSRAIATSDRPGNRTNLPAPVRQPNAFDKTLAFVGNFVQSSLPSVVQAWGISEQGKTQRWLAEQNTLATLGQAEYQFLTDSAMFDSFTGFGDNMTSVANTATTNATILGQSYGSEMKQVATTFAQEQTNQIEAYTENFRNNTYIQLEDYHYENSQSESHSSSSTATNTTTLPDWLNDDPDPDPTP